MALSAETLIERNKFAESAESLRQLKNGAFAMARRRFQTRPEATFSPDFARDLIRDMLHLHPQLIRRAYQFGVEGNIAQTH